MSHPFFSIVIPTCNRRDILSLCLEKLSPQAQKNFTLHSSQTPQEACDSTYEVIVSDDNSTPDTEKWIAQHYPWANYLHGPKRGPAANRNNGAKQSNGQWLVFIDDDCIPSADLLKAYSIVIEGNQAHQAIEGAIHPTEPVNSDLQECPTNTVGNYFWSANVAIRKNLFTKINGFDEAYPYAAMEDCDIFLRIKDEVTTVPFASQAIVKHPVRTLTLKEALKKAQKLIPSLAIYHVKNATRLNRNSTSAVIGHHLSFELRNAAKQLLAGHPGWFLYHCYLFSIGTFKLISELKKQRSLHLGSQSL